MTTLLIIMIIWFIISYYRLTKIAKKTNEGFNIFSGTFLDYSGIILGSVTISSYLIFLIVKYLP